MHAVYYNPEGNSDAFPYFTSFCHAHTVEKVSNKEVGLYASDPNHSKMNTFPGSVESPSL